jgi:mono/diheme cytochrome c family protein
MKQIMLLLLLFFVVMACNEPQKAQKTASDAGQKVYSTYCLSCHQADGSGVPKMNPPLIKTEWVLGDKTRLINIVLHGFQTPIEVNGDSYNGVMAAHDFLKDEDIAHVLTYVRSNFGNAASEITAAEVAEVRGKK